MNQVSGEIAAMLHVIHNSPNSDSNGSNLVVKKAKTTRKRRLVCAFVIHIQQSGFLTLRYSISL